VLTMENSFVSVLCGGDSNSAVAGVSKKIEGINSGCRFGAVEITVVIPRCHGEAVGDLCSFPSL